MNFYEIGKKDGASQYRMDKLSDSVRGGSLLIYTAIQSEHFEMALDRLSLAEYVGGFVESYVITRLEAAAKEAL